MGPYGARHTLKKCLCLLSVGGTSVSGWKPTIGRRRNELEMLCKLTDSALGES